MQQTSLLQPVRYGLNDELSSLFSRHYFEQVLPGTVAYRQFDAAERIAAIEQLIEADSFRNEADVEEKVIRPVFRALGLNYDVQTGLSGQSADYSIYSGNEFQKDYTNTLLLVEAEPYGKLNKRYFIKKQDNSDPIAQIRNYLRSANEQLANNDSGKSIEFGLLTDGGKWRVYSRKFTHSDRQFEQNFLEFNFTELRSLDNSRQRDYLKLFCYLLSEDGLTKHLHQTVTESSNHEAAVTTELRKQVYPALELIATGLWRRVMQDEDAGLRNTLESRYGFNEAAIDDVQRRPELLKVIYDESLVFLLRLLFILYIEDRKVTDIVAIKQPGGILEAIRSANQPIGQLSEAHNALNANYDVVIAGVCQEIDRRYNGGIFSDKQHSLLSGFNIDDTLFANAIDNLCRVKVGQQILTVDFSSISIRELGTLYEGLLEYKFAVADQDIGELTTIADRKKKRLNVAKGDLYLINQNGERKSTGSYYTPDTIVNYLVAQTVGARMDKALAGITDPLEQLEALGSITICDPAMGSGHFLVQAFDDLVNRAERIVEANELVVNLADVRAWLARQCIYGADLNPIAVDIAKMVMWIRIFRADKPLEFFDANFVSGDSLIGSYDDMPVPAVGESMQLLTAPEEYEPQMLSVLAERTRTLQAMPRNTRDEVKALETYYRTEIVTYQKNITFLAHLRLTKFLLPKEAGFVAGYYEDVASILKGQHDYIVRLYQKRHDLNKKQAKLFEIVEQIERQFRPVHWKARFPHIFVQGGFDVVLGNPPWDVVKPNHNHFFSDYIDGYDRLETKEAKVRSAALAASQPQIGKDYQGYQTDIEVRNKFFRSAYEHQIVKNSKGKALSGDPNLYKVFIEKAYTLLKPGGACGFVVPSGLNTDEGCSGLRRLLFNQATVRELVMFENKRGIFPAVHRQYKFDALVYEKARSKSPKFSSGFYWLDPRWLSGEPEGLDPTVANSERQLHERYPYPLHLSEAYSPEMYALIEARNSADIPILEQIAKQPLLGDDSQPWYATAYREFDMTNDAGLFDTDGVGYPLMEGKTIHQFNAEFADPTRYVLSEQGEARLAAKWRTTPEQLPNRGYRIAYRSIGRSTDSRTLIATILPPYVFTGNSLNVVKVHNIEATHRFVAGVLVLLNSFVADYVLRFRVSANVNSYYVKELPFIRDTAFIADIGGRALPLFAGRDFRDFRGGIAETTDPNTRMELRAELDARVAKAYGLSYEQLQHVLLRFPQIQRESPEIIAEVLRAYRSL